MLDTDQAFENQPSERFDEIDSDEIRHLEERLRIQDAFDRLEISALAEALRMYGPARMGNYPLFTRLLAKLEAAKREVAE